MTLSDNGRKGKEDERNYSMRQVADLDLPPSNDEICRELTLTDVQKALCPLTQCSGRLMLKLNDIEHRMICFPIVDICSIIDKSSCCALVRLDRHSSRLLLPLARRSRTDFSQHPSMNLCSTCHRIREEQYVHLRRELEFPLISTDEQIRLTTDATYSSTPEMLVWNLNNVDSSIVYDTGSLTDEEKKTLLRQTLAKLQLMLLNQSSTYNDDHQRTICRTLQRTIEILSSSIESNRDNANHRVK